MHLPIDTQSVFDAKQIIYPFISPSGEVCFGTLTSLVARSVAHIYKPLTSAARELVLDS